MASMRRKLGLLVAALLIACGYALLSMRILDALRQRSNLMGASVSQFEERACEFVFGFPFYFLGVSQDFALLPILNGLYWGIVLVGVDAYFRR